MGAPGAHVVAVRTHDRADSVAAERHGCAEEVIGCAVRRGQHGLLRPDRTRTRKDSRAPRRKAGGGVIAVGSHDGTGSIAAQRYGPSEIIAAVAVGREERGFFAPTRARAHEDARAARIDTSSHIVCPCADQRARSGVVDGDCASKVVAANDVRSAQRCLFGPRRSHSDEHAGASASVIVGHADDRTAPVAVHGHGVSEPFVGRASSGDERLFECPHISRAQEHSCAAGVDTSCGVGPIRAHDRACAIGADRSGCAKTLFRTTTARNERLLFRPRGSRTHEHSSAPRSNARRIVTRSTDERARPIGAERHRRPELILVLRIRREKHLLEGPRRARAGVNPHTACVVSQSRSVIERTDDCAGPISVERDAMTKIIERGTIRRDERCFERREQRIDDQRITRSLIVDFDAHTFFMKAHLGRDGRAIRIQNDKRAVASNDARFAIHQRDGVIRKCAYMKLSFDRDVEDQSALAGRTFRDRQAVFEAAWEGSPPFEGGRQRITPEPNFRVFDRGAWCRELSQCAEPSESGELDRHRRR